MNKKIINIVASVLMFVAFFQQWINFFGYGGGSPYQAVKQVFKNLKFVEKEPLILLTLLLLIFPISAIIIFLFHIKPEIKKNELNKINAYKKIPLLFIIIVIIYGVFKMGDGIKMLKDIDFTEIIGIGFVITMISSLVLFFNKTEEINITKNNSLEEKKEEINKDNLFN